MIAQILMSFLATSMVSEERLICCIVVIVLLPNTYCSCKVYSEKETDYKQQITNLIAPVLMSFLATSLASLASEGRFSGFFSGSCFGFVTSSNENCKIKKQKRESEAEKEKERAREDKKKEIEKDCKNKKNYVTRRKKGEKKGREPDREN